MLTSDSSSETMRKACYRPFFLATMLMLGGHREKLLKRFNLCMMLFRMRAIIGRLELQHGWALRHRWLQPRKIHRMNQLDQTDCIQAISQMLWAMLGESVQQRSIEPGWLVRCVFRRKEADVCGSNRWSRWRRKWLVKPSGTSQTTILIHNLPGLPRNTSNPQRFPNMAQTSLRFSCPLLVSSSTSRSDLR